MSKVLPDAGRPARDFLLAAVFSGGAIGIVAILIAIVYPVIYFAIS